MAGIHKTLNVEEYLAAINQLQHIDPRVDATQQAVEDQVVRGMMRLWGSHYAAVVAKDGPDTVTYENYNRDTEADWEIIDIFNEVFSDFEAFRDYVGTQTDALNLNASTEQASQYIQQAHDAMAGVVADADSLQDRYKKALAKAHASISTSLKTDADHKRKLVYFQMYGPAEQSFHATFRGQTSNPMTMRVAPSLAVAMKSAQKKLKENYNKFKAVMGVPGNSPWKEIYAAFFHQYVDWHEGRKALIEAAPDYKSMLELMPTLDPGFDTWNSDLRIAIVDKVKELVGDPTLAAPTSRQDVLDTLQAQLEAHEVASYNITPEGFRKHNIHRQLETLRHAAVNVR
jgi:hypothetical protein